MIELVDFNDVYGKTAPNAAEPAKKTRRSGSAKKIAAITETETAEATPAAEATDEKTEA